MAGTEEVEVKTKHLIQCPACKSTNTEETIDKHYRRCRDCQLVYRQGTEKGA